LGRALSDATISVRIMGDEMMITSVARRGLAAMSMAAAMVAAVPVMAADPVKVGVVLPMTSVLSTYGKPYLEALTMAVEEINAAGGVKGAQIELVVEDAQASNTVTINALNKVMLSNPVVVFGSALGTQALALMPLTEKAKVPLISGTSTRRVTQQGAKYLFRISAHDAIDKEVATRFMVEDLKKKKIGIMHVANEWGYSGRDNVTAVLATYGLKPVSIASYQVTDKDFTAPILQMTKDGADVIFTQGHPVDEALIVQQMQKLDINLAHLGSASLCNSYLQSLVALSEVSGQYCEGPYPVPLISPDAAVRAFAERYKVRAGYYPDAYMIFYYDIMKMVGVVMNEYGADSESIRKGMAEKSYKGLVGTFKSDEEGNMWHGASIMQFTPQGMTVLKMPKM
jgi:branched-chain amino acid transport system substrate-binding protein